MTGHMTRPPDPFCNRLQNAPASDNWTDKYIGIPFTEGGRDFAGCDCGGLVLLALRLEKGVTALDFNDYGKGAFKTLRGFALLGEGIESLMHEWLPVDVPRAFDLVRFRYGRLPCHVGIYAGSCTFLHVEEAQGVARITDMNDLSWGPRFVDFRRHRELMEVEA